MNLIRVYLRTLGLLAPGRGALACLLPRQSRGLRLLLRAAAACARAQLAAPLVLVVCAIFASLTAFVMRKTEAMQKLVEENYSELAERASDTLGNVALVHSFTRVEAEVSRP